MKNNRKKTKNAETNANLMTCLYCSGIAVAVSVGVSLVLVLLFAAIALLFDDPVFYARILAYVALYVSALLCGGVSRALCRDCTLFCGLLSGGIFCAAVIVFSLLHTSSGNVGFSFLLHLALPVFSVLGAFITSYKPKKRKRRKR